MKRFKIETVCHRVIKRWVGFFIYMICGVSAAGTASEHLVTQLQAIKSMTADFSQSIAHPPRHDVSQRSSGTMALLRPGQFRWQTIKPMSQLVLANGKKIYIYDKELEQVTIKSQSSHLSGSAGVFLSVDKSMINRDFDVTEATKTESSRYTLQAKSHQESISRLQLLFVKGLLTEIDLFDQLGQHTRIKLTHIKTNVTLNKSLFQFVVPKDTDVVQQ